VKYQENSIQEILELSCRNPIINNVLSLFHITDESPGILVWQQALIYMVKALVEYSNSLAKQNYDLTTKSVKGPQININLNDLPEKEKAKILEILRGRKE
jgi:hypothetical protein